MSAQQSLLERGPNFAITNKHPPKEAYIMAIEETCTKLTQGRQRNSGQKPADY